MQFILDRQLLNKNVRDVLQEATAEALAMLAFLTAGHQRADVSCRSRKATVSVAEHYLHMPEDLSEDDLIALVDGEG